MGTCFFCEYYKFGVCYNEFSPYYKEEREEDAGCVDYELYILEKENDPLDQEGFF